MLKVVSFLFFCFFEKEQSYIMLVAQGSKKNECFPFWHNWYLQRCAIATDELPKKHGWFTNPSVEKQRQKLNENLKLKPCQHMWDANPHHIHRWGNELCCVIFSYLLYTLQAIKVLCCSHLKNSRRLKPQQEKMCLSV